MLKDRQSTIHNELMAALPSFFDWSINPSNNGTPKEQSHLSVFYNAISKDNRIPLNSYMKSSVRYILYKLGCIR